MCGKFVDRALDGEAGLAEPVAAEGAGRRRVRVHHLGVHPLVGATVHADRGRAGVIEHAAAMIAVGAGVGQHVDRQSLKHAACVAAGAHARAHGMTMRRGRDRLRARELECAGASGAQRRQHHDILDQHLLLGAETAADPAGNHADALARDREQPCQRIARQERHLRAGAHHDRAVRVDRGQRTMRLERRVMQALGVVFGLDHVRAARECCLDIADTRMEGGQDVARRLLDARIRVLVVHHRRAGRARGLGVGHRRQNLPRDRQRPRARLRCRRRLGDHGGHALPDMPRAIVEDRGVVGIVSPILVARGGEQPMLADVVMREHAHDARHGERRRAVDAEDACMGVRRAHQPDVQRAGRCLDIEGEGGGTRHDLAHGGRRQIAAMAARVRVRVDDPVDRIGDRAIAGAAADVALQRAGRCGALRLVEAGRGHDHARRAIAALERAGLRERRLHRVQGAIRGGQPRDRGDRAPGRAERRHQAGMERLAVDQHRAGAAIARVAAAFDAERAELAQRCAQALAGVRRENAREAVEHDHDRASTASRARRCVM